MTDNQKDLIANRVENIAWIIEACVISFGVIVSVALTFPDFPKGLNSSISSLASFGFFAMLAISELSKIPLAQVFVASSSFKVKMCSLVALSAVLIVSTDNLITGGDVVQKQRLQPILDVKKEIEKRNNDLRAINLEIANISLALPESTEKLILNSDIEINEKEIKISRIRQEIESINFSNNAGLKEAINREISILSPQIKEAKKQIEKLRQDLINDVKKLNDQKLAEMDRSFLRDRAIGKDYDQKIESKESVFAKDKSSVELSLNQKQKKLNTLYTNLRNADQLSGANQNYINELLSDIHNIQSQIKIAEEIKKDLIKSSLIDKKIQEANKKSLINNASTIENAIYDSKLQFDHLIRENFVYRIASYIFTKDPNEISDEEYGFFNLIFIFSIAIGLSILPSFLAGISSSLKMEKNIKLTKKRFIDNFFEIINRIKERQDESRVRKLNVKEIQAEKDLKEAKEREQEQEKRKRLDKQQNLEKENNYKSRINQLEKELAAKPKVIEKEVTEFVDRPYCVGVPVPPMPGTNSLSSEFLNSFKSYFKTQNNKNEE